MKRFTWLAALVLLATAGPASAVVSVFDFDGNLAATTGTAQMSLFNDDATFGAFDTAIIGGQATGVYKFNAATPTQGLTVTHGAPANGGGAYVNQFSIGYDILLTGGAEWASFFQTNMNNANDGDLFRNPAKGIGISGQYQGTVEDDQWYRLFFVFDMADADGDGKRLYKYINGALVGTQALDALDGRWSLDPLFHLLADETGGETSAGSLSSFYFNDRVLSPDEVAALGGPTAGGFAANGGVIPEPGTLTLLGLGALGAFRARRRNR